jgi:sporulation protein YlmC with PRC-barrel domain
MEKEIPVEGKIVCTDGECGRLEQIIVDPIDDRITHLVVRGSKRPHEERLVPVNHVSDTSQDTIHLNIPMENFDAMEPFCEQEFLQVKIPRWDGYGYMSLPYTVPRYEIERRVVEHPRIPRGELAIKRGTHVEASDGRIGQVDEFLVDPSDGQITHLILREGHLWGSRDVCIPVGEIDRIEAEHVYLKLSKREVESLPEIELEQR